VPDALDRPPTQFAASFKVKHKARIANCGLAEGGTGQPGTLAVFGYLGQEVRMCGVGHVLTLG
jgi:hypothetical protein